MLPAPPTAVPRTTRGRFAARDYAALAGWLVLAITLTGMATLQAEPWHSAGLGLYGLWGVLLLLQSFRNRANVTLGRRRLRVNWPQGFCWSALGPVVCGNLLWDGIAATSSERQPWETNCLVWASILVVGVVFGSMWGALAADAPAKPRVVENPSPPPPEKRAAVEQPAA